jgi:hypothetical protein
MKLISKLFRLNSLIKLIILFLVVCQMKSETLEKVLFMFKYRNVEHDPKHLLNVLSYKNLVFSPSEITIYESKNPNEPVSENLSYAYIIYNFSDFRRIRRLNKLSLHNQN